MNQRQQQQQQQRDDDLRFANFVGSLFLRLCLFAQLFPLLFAQLLFLLVLRLHFLFHLHRCSTLTACLLRALSQKLRACATHYCQCLEHPVQLPSSKQQPPAVRWSGRS